MHRLFVSNKDESVRMFKSDFLELFSRIHWSVPLYLYIPVVLFFLYRSVFQLKITTLYIVLLFVIGIFMWTITEYILHRFLFHYNPRSEFGRRIHFMFHGVHHDYPQDSKRLVMVPIVSITLAVVFYLIFTIFLGTSLVAPFFSGFVLGYLLYDMTHYAVHHFAFKNKIFLKLKQHHMKHHYKYPEMGFGVSTPAWDYLFGTKYPE